MVDSSDEEYEKIARECSLTALHRSVRINEAILTMKIASDDPAFRARIQNRLAVVKRIIAERLA